MDMTLKNQRVVVIGGSSGLGLATAKLAAAQGASVLIAGRSREKLDKALQEIGHGAEARPLDVTREADVAEFFEGAGPLDHLTTPGNQGARGPFLELPVEKARAGFDSKFWGQYMAARYAAPHIRPGGSIVLMSGTFSQKPGPGSATQSSINSAVEGLGRALAFELAPHIRVNVISPGTIDTPMHAWRPAEQHAAFFQSAARASLVKRVGQAEDVAHAIVFLMTNPHVTGLTLYLNGGAFLV
jgi:NAD(P)-dependent dehydrogenase (short-subunit alcohol dehydrogenase family)